MTSSHPEAFAQACCDLVGQIAVNASLAEAVIRSIDAGRLQRSSGPIAINSVLKGYTGIHSLRAFLKAWNTSAPHLDAHDVTATLRSSLAAYRLAQSRAHIVDAVWTGPEVEGSEMRRTEAVVNEVVSGAKRELLVVGYWLVTRSAQIGALIDLLISRARDGVQVRFVFDPGAKSFGEDNLGAIEERWPGTLSDAPREIYTWAEETGAALIKAGTAYARKLHAKVIVADRLDALVTSANLTAAGMLENLEMGLRVHGVAAGAVARHFDLLIDEGVLVRW